MAKEQALNSTKKQRTISLWAWAFAVVATGLALAAFFNLYVSREFNPLNADLLSLDRNPALAGNPALLEKESFLAEGRQTGVVWSTDGAITVPFVLSDPAAVTLRLQAYFPKVTYAKPPLSIYVNGEKAGMVEPEWEDGYEEFSVRIPGGPFLKDANTLAVRPEAPGAFRVGYETISVRDFIGYSKNYPRAFVFFDENVAGKRRVLGKPLSFVLFPVLVFVLWVVAGNVMSAAKGVYLSAALRRMLWWYAPGIILLAAAYLYTAVTQATVVLHPDTFFTVVLAPALISVLVYMPRLVSTGAKRLLSNDPGGSGVAGRSSVLEALARLKPDDVKRVRSVFTTVTATAATAAVALFILTLATAGVLLALKRQATAETMADIAYFSLLFGVLLRLFDLTRPEGN